MSLAESGQAGGTCQVVVTCWAIAAANGTNFLFTRDAVARGSVPTGGCTGPRRGAGNCFTPFCPRRTRRGAEKGNCNSFCPRRARGTALHLFVRGGRGEARRRATATPFVREGRGELLYTFVRGGRGGARRRATATPFVRGGRGELLYTFVRGGRGGARRRATATPFVRGGRGELLYTFLSAEDAEGRGEGQLQLLLSAEGAEGCFAPFCRGDSWGRRCCFWGLRMFSDEPFALQFAVAAEVEEEADLEAGGFQIVEELGVFFAGELIERL